jgi:hypothetical protein
MKLLKRENIIDLKWNDCIRKSPNGLMYGLTWFLDALVDRWEGLVWEKDKEYIAVFPIPIRKKFGFKYVYPPFFIQQLGLFSVKGKNEKEAITYLNTRFKFVELNLNSSAEIGQNRTNLLLPLNKDYESIKAKYTSNHKRNLKKSYNSDLLIKNANINDLIGLFRINKGAELSNLKDCDYQRLHNLLMEAEKQSCLTVKGVFKSEKLICGGVFIKFKNRIIFIFSCNTSQGRDCGALFYLLNSIIKQYSCSGFILDFEGSQNKGLARFYSGFGAKEEGYKFYRHNNLPTFLRRIKNTL